MLAAAVTAAAAAADAAARAVKNAPLRPVERVSVAR